MCFALVMIQCFVIGLLVVDGMPVHKVCLSNRGIAWQSTVNINCPVCIGSKLLCLGRQWSRKLKK